MPWIWEGSERTWQDLPPAAVFAQDPTITQRWVNEYPSAAEEIGAAPSRINEGSFDGGYQPGGYYVPPVAVAAPQSAFEPPVAPAPSVLAFLSGRTDEEQEKQERLARETKTGFEEARFYWGGPEGEYGTAAQIAQWKANQAKSIAAATASVNAQVRTAGYAPAVTSNTAGLEGPSEDKGMVMAALAAPAIGAAIKGFSEGGFSGALSGLASGFTGTSTAVTPAAGGTYRRVTRAQVWAEHGRRLSNQEFAQAYGYWPKTRRRRTYRRRTNGGVSNAALIKALISRGST